MTLHTLTKEELRQVQDDIRDSFLHVSAQMEDDAFRIPLKVFRGWKCEKIVAEDVLEEDFATARFRDGAPTYNPFIFGRLQIALGYGETLEEIKTRAIKDPLLRPNIFAIEAIHRSFGANPAEESKRIRDMLEDFFSWRLKATTSDGECKREFGHPIPEKIVTDWKGLSAELYHSMISRSTDWDHFAFCKVQNAKGQAECLRIIAEHGPHALVYKMPLPTACPQCKHLYLETDQKTPRLYEAAEILAWGTNHGRKRMPTCAGRVISLERADGAETWKPVAGITHPWCNCGHPFLLTRLEPWAKKALSAFHASRPNLKTTSRPPTP